jgi:hypothetical protein
MERGCQEKGPVLAKRAAWSACFAVPAYTYSQHRLAARDTTTLSIWSSRCLTAMNRAHNLWLSLALGRETAALIRRSNDDAAISDVDFS